MLGAVVGLPNGRGTAGSSWSCAPPYPHILQVTVRGGGDVWRLCFPSDEVLKKWQEALSQAADGRIATNGGGDDGPQRPGLARGRSRSGTSGGGSSFSLKRRSRSRSGSRGSRGGGHIEPQVPGMPVNVIPTRFIDGCGGDEVEAARRWGLTHAWRRDNAVDGYLASPPAGKHVKTLKKLYKHFFHRRAKNGHIVYYDQIQGATQPEILTHITRKELADYYLYISEYCYLALEPDDPGGRIVNVYDLSMLSMGDCWPSSNAVKLAKEIISACGAHYPERADKVFVINAPRFFTGIWNIISPIVDPRTRAKINIATGDRTKLFEYIDEACVPAVFGGSDPTPPGEAPEELDMINYTLRCASLDEADAAAARHAAAAGHSFAPPPRDPHAILAEVRAVRGARPRESGDAGSGELPAPRQASGGSGSVEEPSGAPPPFKPLQAASSDGARPASPAAGPLRVGDKVTWTKSDPEIPEGAVGTVLALTVKGRSGQPRVQCSFPAGAFALPENQLRVAPGGGGGSGGGGAASSALALASGSPRGRGGASSGALVKRESVRERASVLLPMALSMAMLLFARIVFPDHH